MGSSWIQPGAITCDTRQASGFVGVLGHLADGTSAVDPCRPLYCVVTNQGKVGKSIGYKLHVWVSDLLWK